MIVHPCVQGSPEWLALRVGRPTASCFDKLITSDGSPSKSLYGYAITLAGEKYSGVMLDAWEGNAYTERGKVLEDDARRAYAFLHDAEPVSIGFVTDDLTRFGCSPDSLIGSAGMAEIKCLKAENHIKAILYFKKHKKSPPDYVQQTQGQILICEREWCDLYFYHPDLPPLVIRQERNEPLIAAIKSQIENVITERDVILGQLREAGR